VALGFRSPVAFAPGSSDVGRQFGAIVLAKVEQGVLEESVLRGWLKGGLARADDRALFGL
jgi:hypothetical protein